MSELPGPPSPTPSSAPVGRFLVGVFLVLLGIGWLLHSLDVVSVEWDLLLPIGLIAVGIALVIVAWYGGSRGALITLGAVLTVILTIGTFVRIPLAGGVGDRTERPPTLGDRTYELSIGKLTVDLGGAVPGEGGDDVVRVAARVGIGQLVVIVPDQIPCVSTHARAGIGEVNVFGERRGGIGPDLRTEAVCLAAPVLSLELSVGLGQVEVHRG